jgi:SecD/SecF fusion protein
MEKQKNWQFYLILAVIVLTLYNILPTIFFYAKPLHDPVDASRAANVSEAIVGRVNGMEEDAQKWLASFCRLLGIKPTEVSFSESNPRLIEISFANVRDANLFRRFLPAAGASIPFVPAQLELAPGSAALENTKVLVARQIGVHLAPEDIEKLFVFSDKRSSDGSITDFYRQIVNSRVELLALAFAGESRQAQELVALSKLPADQQENDAVLSIARNIVDVQSSFANEPSFRQRYFASLTQTAAADSDSLLTVLIARMEAVKKDLAQQQQSLQKELQGLAAGGVQIDGDQKQHLALLERQGALLDSAIALVSKERSQFKGSKPLSHEEIAAKLKAGASMGDQQMVSLDGRNPYVEALLIDWENGRVILQFYSDIARMRDFANQTELAAYTRDKVNQYIINDIAAASQYADEKIVPSESSYIVALDALSDSSSFLALNLARLSQMQSNDLLNQLAVQWTPLHSDLSRELFPIYSYQDFQKLPPEEQKLGLVVYSPAMEEGMPPEGIHPGSSYVIARGLDNIVQKYRETPDAPEAKQLVSDIDQLNRIMQSNGFISYPGSSFGMPLQYSKDYIFELSDYYNYLLKATREAFAVKGDKRYAVLDFSNVEQRILATNAIDDRQQEDLLKWKEAYSAAQVDLDATHRYLVPAPTKNVYWENFKLSFKKYFRGDERKILKWGLDLSGGKTVRIGLRDSNNRPVTNPDDLKKAVNELYVRVNNMGVAERTIHVENDNIILDFPGSQALSAAELIKASAMYFHIVNEKFTTNNPALRGAVSQFLQDVWNEAVVTNRQDIESINLIAWEHLGGENNLDQLTRPRSEVAKILYDNGLRIANPKIEPNSNAFNDTLSAIGMLRDGVQGAWSGQTTPLVILFHSYALEGANITDVRVGYDSTKGNNLSFTVKKSYDNDELGNPRDNFYAWTSQFAADQIAGTPKEAYAKDGWHMAVVLNGTIISAPSLPVALRDGGTITGRFSPREINQLAADLKAGSLSFTPRILSEENVSPELGAEERTRGILASCLGLVAVVAAMVGYYHFAGVVASVAVLFNILIMWGVLQNLGAALSLPTIAGIVLTIGMAVDANVLVFERIREEFSVSGRIASAIQAGYRKAFSAIIDSNLTSIIAAIILIQFDSGPIKGFAVALIVGIVSSMFTALFMTRYFFAGWVQKPENRSLKMSQFFTLTNFDFLGQTRKAVIISVIAILLGGAMFYAQRSTMFAMDFTGGYALNLEVAEQPGHPNYRLEVLDALQAAGAGFNDVQVRELNRPNQLRIQLGMGMEEVSKPFHDLPEIAAAKEVTYGYQHNPRIMWVVDTLAKAGIAVTPEELSHLDQNWTVMSGQFSEVMRWNAVKGLLLALLCILIYITVRFEFKYGIAAVIGLVHDVLITMGILAFFNWLGMPVSIDLAVVGALMTLVGYSLNDTIIVFDRIREDIKLLRKLSLPAVINHALNVTLSRTVMTSGTTFLVLLSLILIGGQSIFAFSLVMAIGIVVGTLSSLFIAAPAMLWFHNYELSKVVNGQVGQPKLKKA